MQEQVIHTNMKKIFILGLFLISAASYGQLDTLDIVRLLNAGNGRRAGSEMLKVQTAIQSIPAPDYLIEKIGANVLGHPGRNTLTALQDTNLTAVLQDAIDALTSGGIIRIKKGLYDDMDSVVVNNDFITIEGDGMHLTKLKLRGNFDVARSESSAMLDMGGHDFITIRNIDFDGNMANQTKIDDNDWGNGYYIFIQGLYGGGNWGEHSDNILIENCYVHDFTGNGIQLHRTDGSIIRNCISENSGSNQINYSDSCSNSIIENCKVSGGGDVAISIGGIKAGINLTVRNCEVYNVTGLYGSNGAMYGIEIGDNAKRCNVIGNYITGVGMLRGIYGCPNTRSCVIADNIIDNIHKTGAKGIYLTSDSGSVISNNKITKIHNTGISLNASVNCQITNNYISMEVGSSAALELKGSYSTGSYISGNYFYNFGDLAISFGASCSDNIITNNILRGADWKDVDIPITATGTIWTNNYGVKTGGWLNTTGLWSNTAIATSGGLTTGILTEGNQNVTVSSANATYICCLPAASAATIGTKITGTVAANGFELRVAASQATTVYINGVTTNVEAAIPANSSFEVTCIDATHWILKAWTALGAEVAAIVPDAV